MVSCPRCGGPVRPPDLMHTESRCDGCGPVPPLHVAEHIGAEIVASVAHRLLATAGPGRAGPVPLWAIWPLLAGWTLTGVGWVGDDREAVRATVTAFSGPAPVSGGPADLVLVAEEPGVGLGTRFAGLPGPDPGQLLTGVLGDQQTTAGGLGGGGPHAKLRAGGHPTPLWSVPAEPDRCAYVGEACGRWLYAVAWPANAGYLLAEEIVLHDLSEEVPTGIVYGAPSPYLHGKA
ncbi:MULTISPECIES: DUF6758 family protein [unclassified Micromonospora]|uniref:DUF6758 family protein n=1 Tax=unclassified Micromonospora TaxID=2617518 RepID=UPI003A8BE201